MKGAEARVSAYKQNINMGKENDWVSSLYVRMLPLKPYYVQNFNSSLLCGILCVF